MSLPFIDSANDKFDKGVLEACLKLVTQALCNPVPPISDTSEERGKSQRICSASFIHQSDIVLRKLIRNEMSATSSAMLKDDVKQEAKLLNGTKADLLEDMRHGHLTIPAFVITSVENQNDGCLQQLETILKEEFQARLSSRRKGLQKV